MHGIDWLLFFGFLAYVIWDGARRGRGAESVDDYFMAGRTVPWWAVGLSIMATQASAITMVGTTGQGWADGLRFVQFYFALPIAMLILAFVAVPAYQRLRVNTAYEYLGRRFDEKTRLLSAVLFLFLRGLSVGFVIYTPSLVLSKMFGLPLKPTIVFMGGVAVAYTAFGGLKAVIWTDVKQMTVMVVGLIAAFVAVSQFVVGEVGWGGALRLAGETGRLTAVDWSWDPSEKYTIWSSLIGGLFLFLSYFGTDQSQVQRLLAGRSVRDAQGALLLNAIFKVPFQFLVLFLGTLLFVFYVLQGSPIAFEPGAQNALTELPDGKRGAYTAVVEEYIGVQGRLELAARDLVAAEPAEVDAAAASYKDLLSDSDRLRDDAREIRGGVSDTNYVFLDFIVEHLPIGIVGLLLAAIFAAALSSIDSEINAMTTVAVLDLWARKRKEGDVEKNPALLRASRWATVLVGAFATAFAAYAEVVGSLVEAVNKVGSYVYGSLLGAFVLAFIWKKSNGHGAFVGLIVGMVAVGLAAQTDLAFLYLNTVGTLTVVVVGIVVSAVTGGRREAS